MLFEENLLRKPDKYASWCNEFIDKIWQGFWTVNEFNFTSDVQNYRVDLSDQEREVIKRTASAIAQIEVAVKTFWAKLGNTLKHPSIIDLGIVMASNEVVHNRAYEKILDVLQLHDVFAENMKLDIIKGRVNYLKKYNEKNYENDRKQFVYSLILFTLFVENVSLFSQFYIILHFNRFKNVMKDLAQQVQYTRLEEQLHFSVGAQIINTLRTEYPELFDAELEARVRHEAEEAFKAESNIVDWMLGDYNDNHLNSDILKEFIKNRINDSFSSIGFNKIFEPNPKLIEETEWFETELFASSLTDFFHKRPVDYAKNSQSFDPDSLF